MMVIAISDLHAPSALILGLRNLPQHYRLEVRSPDCAQAGKGAQNPTPAEQLADMILLAAQGC